MIDYIQPRQPYSGNGEHEKEFVVEWAVRIGARDFVEAAEKALKLQRMEDGNWTCFLVRERSSNRTKLVDFEKVETLEDPTTPDPEEE